MRMTWKSDALCYRQTMVDTSFHVRLNEAFLRFTSGLSFRLSGFDLPRFLVRIQSGVLSFGLEVPRGVSSQGSIEWVSVQQQPRIVHMPKSSDEPRHPKKRWFGPDVGQLLARPLAEDGEKGSDLRFPVLVRHVAAIM